MERKEFDPTIFMEVIESNAVAIANAIVQDARKQVVLIGSPSVTENETRKMATDFITYQLSKLTTQWIQSKMSFPIR